MKRHKINKVPFLKQSQISFANRKLHEAYQFLNILSNLLDPNEQEPKREHEKDVNMNLFIYMYNVHVHIFEHENGHKHEMKMYEVR